MKAIEARDVWKRFRRTVAGGETIKSWLIEFARRGRSEELWALRGASFELDAREGLGVIGPNGSGKTTLLRVLAGIYAPERGTVRVAGKVAAMIELGAGFHPELTGRENIFLTGAVHGLRREEIRRRLDAIVALSGLEAFVDTPVKFYSSGMHARLAFAICAHLDARVLLVDEVFAVGDAEFQRRCLEWMHDFQRDGGSLVLVTHDLGQVERHCSRAMLLERGVVVAIGPPRAIVRRYQRAAAGPSAVPAAVADGRRWGDGRVTIRSVRIAGASGRALTSGKPAHIELTYECPRPLRDVVLGVGIHRSDGQHVVGVNSETLRQRLPAIAGRGRAVFRIAALPLTSGEYVLSVSAHDAGMDSIYDHHDRLYPFAVHDPSVTQAYGVVSLPGRWSVEPATTSAGAPARTAAPGPARRA